MRYAIVRSGGKQYRVVEGETIDVERLGLEIGKKIELDDILLASDGENVIVGAPTISGAKVSVTVLDQVKGPKVTIFKYHPRKRYRLKKGHRQKYTRLMVNTIQAAGLPKASPEKAEKPATASKAKPQKAKSTPTKSSSAKKESPKAGPATKEAPKSSAPSTRRKLSGFDIAEKIVGLLEEAGISTVSQLLKSLEGGDAAVLEIKGLGPKALEDIKTVLKKEGYKLP